MYADWTDRIAQGELPAADAGASAGPERNVVITMWDWADPKVYLHDEIASDKRNPTVNAERSDLRRARRERRLPAGDRSEDEHGEPDQADAARSGYAELGGSAAGGAVAVLGRRSDLEQQDDGPQLRDGQAGSRVGRGARPQAGRRRHGARPDRIIRRRSCFPINQGQRGLIMYDPKTKQTTTIDTCFTWGHVNFDDNDVLWSSFGPAGVEGWFDTKIWDKTHDEKQAQGWSAFVARLQRQRQARRLHRAESAGRSDEGQAAQRQFYGDSPAPDGSVWGTVQGMPGALVRFVPGAHPPETALTEFYEVPWNNPKAPAQGFAPRGMDVDSKGVVWTVLSSGHLASFDRSKCKGPLNGPTATGQHCPEGWTLYPLPGSELQGRGRTARAPTRRTTTSSIASTCSASARTCRSRPAICRKDCWRWWTASS